MKLCELLDIDTNNISEDKKADSRSQVAIGPEHADKEVDAIVINRRPKWDTDDRGVEARRCANYWNILPMSVHTESAATFTDGWIGEEVEFRSGSRHLILIRKQSEDEIGEIGAIPAMVTRWRPTGQRCPDKEMAVLTCPSACGGQPPIQPLIHSRTKANDTGSLTLIFFFTVATRGIERTMSHWESQMQSDDCFDATHDDAQASDSIGPDTLTEVTG